MSKFNLQAAGLLYDGYWGSGYAGLYAGLYSIFRKQMVNFLDSFKTA